jgi:hypothetical protein
VQGFVEGRSLPGVRQAVDAGIPGGLPLSSRWDRHVWMRQVMPQNSGDSLGAGVLEKLFPILDLAAERLEPGQILGDCGQQEFGQPLDAAVGGRRRDGGVRPAVQFAPV